MNVLGVVFLLGFVFFANGDINDSECDIEGIDNSQWDVEFKNDPINDDANLEKVFNVASPIELVKTEEGKYLKAKVENSKLIIYTTEEFKNFEANEPNSQIQPELRLIMHFKCKNEALSQLSFVQPITDINNHNPEFPQKEYIYKVPMPFMPGVELSNFGTRITAKDIDITNMRITFSVKPEGDFEVTSEGPIDVLKKTHQAVVKATRYLNFDEKKTYTITATDSGNPTRSTEATFVIDVDKETSVPESPAFVSALYKATYDDSENNHKLTFPEEITLLKNYEKISFTISGSNSDKFIATQTNEKVQITLKENLPEDVLQNEKLLTLTLTASIENAEKSAMTAIVIALPKQNSIESPKFAKSFYTATYDSTENDHKIVVEESIKLSKIYDNIQISLSGDHHDNFIVTHDKDTVTVTLKTNLPESVLEEEHFLVLVITGEMKNADNPAVTNLIVALPKENSDESPKFLKPSYKADYDESSEVHKITFAETIKLAQNYENPQINLIGEYQEYFDGKVNGIDVTISLKRNFPEEILSKEKVVVLTLSVKVEGVENSGNTILIIGLPKRNPVESPSFEKPFYVAIYNDKEQTHSVKFEETIALAENYENSQIDISGENSQYFKCEKEPNKKEITVKLVENLPETVLQSQNLLTLTLTAKIASAEATTAIVIDLPTKTNVETPKFTKTFYTATYDTTESIHKLVVQEPVKLSKIYDIRVSLSGSNSQYFVAVLNKDEVQIRLIYNLPESVLEEENTLVLVITGEIKNTGVTGTTNLIISLPKKTSPETPQFLKPSYTANYDESTEEHKITFEDTIKLAQVYKNPKITLLGEYQDYFDTKVEGVDVSISLKKNFPEEIISKEKVVVMTLSVKVEGIESSGNTAIVVAMPRRNPVESPSFAKPFYAATYDNAEQKHSVKFKEAIALSKNYENSKIELSGENSQYFQWEKVEGSTEIKVTLNENLPASILEKESELNLLLSVEIDGAEKKGFSVLVISLPIANPDKSPQFEETFYTATYDDKNEQHSITVNKEIKLIKNFENAQFELEGDNKDHFKIEKVNDVVKITLKENLPESVLESGQTLIFTIRAQTTENSGKSVLVVNLPKRNQQQEETPTFAKPFYAATYDNTEQTHSIKFKEAIALSKNYENSKIELSGENSQYFQFEKVEGNTEIKVTLKENLPPSILEKERELHLLLSVAIDGAEQKGFSVLVISLPIANPDKSPQFDETFYTAAYDDKNEQHSITVNKEIKMIKNFENAQVDLEGDNKDNFKIEKVNDVVKITLKENLPESVLESGQTLIFTIRAQTTENSGKSVLVVNLPKRNQQQEEMPTFEKPFYAATYDNTEQAHSIKFKEAIALSKNYENSKIELSGENSKYFQWEKVDGNTEIKVTLKENLPPSILEKERELYLLLSVEIDGVEQKGFSVLVISLPIANPDKSPQFEETFYTATYDDKNEQHSITVNKEIKLTKNFENAQVNLEGDNNDHFKIEKLNDVVKITLKENLPESVLESGQTLIFTIRAQTSENFGKSVLVVNLPRRNQQGEKAPTFAKDFYKASYDNQNNKHKIIFEEDVTLTDNYKNIEFTVSQDYQTYFEIVQEGTKVEITLKENFPQEHLEKKSVSVKFGVKYIDGTNEGKTIIVIEMPTQQQIESPTFSKPFYQASYNDKNEEHSIDLPEKIKLSKNYEKVDITMDGDQKSYFDFEITGQDISVKLKENLPESVLINGRAVILIFYAEIKGAPYKSSTVLVVALPKKESEVITSFSKTHYLGVYKDDEEKHEVKWKESILLSEDYPNVKIELTGDQENYFEYKRTGKDIKVSVKENLPEDVLKRNKFITLVVHVKDNDSTYTGFSVLLVELPKDDCTTTTTTQSPGSTIEFTRPEYSFTTKPLSTNEIIGQVKAQSKPNAEKIKYELKYEDGSDISKLHISEDGEIKNLDYLNLGKHYLIVTGIGQESGAEGKAKVIITVESVNECENELKTPYALQKTHIIEEEENYNIIDFDTENKNYYYTIVDEYPKLSSENSFEIHPNGSLSCKKIDREADIFKDMLVPQVTLTLNLKKKDSKIGRFKRSREWLHLDNIINDPTQMIVSVIVDDINDNPPIFEESDLIVGYPTKKLASEIFPPYLTVVKATDVDEGINASIVYRIATDKVVVHEKSGVVYPTDKIHDDGDFKFKISAIDRDGTGLETTTEVEVKFLTENHLSLLTTEKLLLENVDEKLRELSAITKFKLKYLTASVIPNKKIRSEDYYLHILAYAFNARNELVTTKELKEALDESEVDDDWNVKPWESTDEDNEEKVAGLIAGVAVLAVLLVLFLLGAGAFYYFKLRKPYARMEEDPDASPKFSRNPKLSNAEPKNVSPIPARRPTGFVFNPPKPEEDDDDDDNNAKFNEIPLERKKSVAFNENVEKINIEHNTVDQSKL